MIHTTTPAASVLVIMGSIRAGRRCPEIAAWVIEQAQRSTALQYELVDLADHPLPMDDEPGIPMLGHYDQPHTLAWSAKIVTASAFIFVTPQYNWGYPAVLKNAVDHLYKEWEGKPAAIVSYGGHSGNKCAAQLRQVLEAVHLQPVETMPGITLTHEMIKGGSIDPEKDFADVAATVQQAISELAAALDHTAS